MLTPEFYAPFRIESGVPVELHYTDQPDEAVEVVFDPDTGRAEVCSTDQWYIEQEFHSSERPLYAGYDDGTYVLYDVADLDDEGADCGYAILRYLGEES